MGVHGLRVRIERCVSRGLTRITAQALGPYQTAIVRIGFGAAWFFFLLREWPHRQELYGPDSPWSWGLAERLIETNDAFSVLMWSSSDNWFQLVYVVALAAAAAVLLGWHTRAATVLFMVGVLSLQNRSVFMGDGGDNVIHLMSMYLVFTRCAQVWSLDARRAARTRRRREAAADRTEDFRAAEQGADTEAPDTETPGGGRPAGAPAAGSDAGVGGVVLWTVLGAVLLGSTVAGGFTVGWALFYWGLWAVHGLWWSVRRAAARGGAAVREMRDVCDILANLVHNGVLLVIMIEVCLVYSTAGWFKIQGTRWQDGTAVYYPMNLDYFTPWPDLSHLLAANGIMVFLVTYGTVATQVAFPFTLLNRRAKNVLLAFMIAEHLSIAVLLGLPFFSLAMIAADAVFLPTVFLIWLGRSTTALGGRARGLLPGRGRRAPRPDPEPAAEVPKVSV
ncbi:HTTM domain-containing protein [Streptomyces sp. WMMB303]|uniref:HTTM domain-containing protein n=1 Tax=Streptomyces sp. WMMB303 TaxID=3034154 RepID=UPI0023ECE66B|nr:HTTM domain-containing protein [Streptomyces sp. WMMB303]MDF4251777.1 HTTM domain-containing protein [Streptomyces sp. WMMB303]